MIACDTKLEALESAKTIGADYAIQSDLLLDFLKEKSLAVDVACDFVGISSTLQTAVKAIRARGRIQIIGMFAFSTTLPSLELVQKDGTIRGCSWGTKEELKEVLKIVERGHVKPVIETRRLSATVDSLDDMAHHRLTTSGRVVFIPDGL